MTLHTICIHKCSCLSLPSVAGFPISAANDLNIPPAFFAESEDSLSLEIVCGGSEQSIRECNVTTARDPLLPRGVLLQSLYAGVVCVGECVSASVEWC